MPYIFLDTIVVTISEIMLRPKYLRLLLAFLPFAGVAEAVEDEDDNTDFLLNVFSDVGP